jgi:hypothetical protein
MIKAKPKMRVVGANMRSVDEWIERISGAWREQLPSIFETGNLLEAAKEELKASGRRGEWLKMVKEQLPFDASTARRLIVIANDGRLRNQAMSPHLPIAWTILHELTQLSDEQFEAGIKSGAINPRMKVKDARALLDRKPKSKPEKKKDEDEPKTVDDWCSMFSFQIIQARAYLNAAEKQELFRHLQRAINELVGDNNE